MKLRVFIVCSGLGNTRRGSESFYRDCFDTLLSEPSIELTLFKGNGKSTKNEIRVWNLPRESRIAIFLGSLRRRSGYFAEQLTFFIMFIPHLLLKRPDIIYLSDSLLANLIHLLRRMIKGKYKVLYANGGNVAPKVLCRWDRIQQVSPQYLKTALEAGVSHDRQTLLPHAVVISERITLLGNTAKNSLRKELLLPENRRIILSVGAISKISKRMDYVIKEVARLPNPRPYLVLLGEKRFDTQEIVELGYRLLSKEGFCARTVSKTEVGNYYKVADVFVLASMIEGFGMVYVEAMSYGLPCLVHDYETARFVLGEMGIYGDLSQNGVLAKLLLALSPADFEREKVLARHAYAYENFSWDKLKPKYVDLLKRCASLS